MGTAFEFGTEGLPGDLHSSGFGALNARDWDRARGALAAEELTRETLETDFRGSYAFNIVTAPADESATTASRAITPTGVPAPCS